MEINTNQVPQDEVIQNEVTLDDLERKRQELRNKQCIYRGFLGGLGAVIIGAILWAVITVLTDYQIGWMAVGVTIPKEDAIILGATILPQQNAAQKFASLKERLEKYGFAFEKSIKRNGAFIVRPMSTRQILLGEDNLALIGEAAGWISPTSAEGLSYAFRSAVALAKSLQENPAHLLRAYARNSRSLLLNIRLKNLKAPFMYNPFLRKAAMKSGLLSMEIYD